MQLSHGPIGYADASQVVGGRGGGPAPITELLREKPTPAVGSIGSGT